MKPQSAKQKGRKFQQKIRDLLLKYAPELTNRDIESTSMGASGHDVKLSQRAFDIYPFAIECKNQERLNLMSAYEQTKAYAKEDEIPIVFHTSNRKPDLVTLEAEAFLKLIRKGDVQGS